jgi:cardiolipin synthase
MTGGAALAPFAEIAVGPNRVALLRDGAETYPAMLAAIEGARSTVCLETYVLADDATGRRFGAALCDRARAGVEVNVLYDAVGSPAPDALVERLREAGVRVKAFRPLRFRGRLWRFVTQFRRRDHRKILVVDGAVGFTGGLNIADDYAPAPGGGGWRDTHTRVAGPAAAELERAFLQTWRRARGAPVDPARYQGRPQSGDPRVRILLNGFRGGRLIRDAYLDAIRGSRRRVRIASAYFLPARRLERALVAAARRGVEVSVLLAGKSDVPVVTLAASHVLGRLLKAGARVYAFTERVLHAKTASVDGAWATVGSSNLDTLSLLFNLEVNAVVESPEFAAALDRMFEEDAARSREITLAAWRARPPLLRALGWFAHLFRGWL